MQLFCHPECAERIINKGEQLFINFSWRGIGSVKCYPVFMQINEPATPDDTSKRINMLKFPQVGLIGSYLLAGYQLKARNGAFKE